LRENREWLIRRPMAITRGVEGKKPPLSFGRTMEKKPSREKNKLKPLEKKKKKKNLQKGWKGGEGWRKVLTSGEGEIIVRRGRDKSGMGEFARRSD